MLKFKVIILFFIFFNVQIINAKESGYSALQILKSPVSPKAAALGNAFTGAAEDVNSLTYNPGSLGLIVSTEAAFMYNQMLADITMNNIAFVSKLKSLTIGANINYVDYDDCGDRTGVTGANDVKFLGGDLNPKDIIVTLSVAKKINPGFSLGGNVKYIKSDLVDEKANAFALDFGAIYKPVSIQELQLGIALKNLGTKIKYYSEKEDLPLTFSIGGQYAFKKLPLNLFLDVNKPNDNDVAFNGGAEYRIAKVIDLRVGYASDFDAGSGLTCGLGLEYSDWKFDYSLQTVKSEFDNIHRFALSKLFGGKTYQQTKLEKQLEYNQYAFGNKKDNENGFYLSANFNDENCESVFDEFITPNQLIK
ncbi:MAG TPA: PorV/PorQ family protein [bacterium]|nr:PorV/PorQ family protein [bacterium]